MNDIILMFLRRGLLRKRVHNGIQSVASPRKIGADKIKEKWIAFTSILWKKIVICIVNLT